MGRWEGVITVMMREMMPVIVDEGDGCGETNDNGFGVDEDDHFEVQLS